jgi:3-hydroxybutyrate dehydrogenase
MATNSFDLSEPEVTTDDLLVLDDPRFGPDTVAIVTGAASGIGQATSVALAANGLSVVGADIDEDGLGETVDLADEVGASGTIHPVATDLTDDEDVEAMIDTAADHGDLRYVANIAGCNTSRRSRSSRWRGTTCFSISCFEPHS